MDLFTNKARLWRMVKFGLIGTSGLIVNNMFLWLFHGQLHIPLELASPMAIAIAIFNNFTWNDLFTWGKDRHQRHFSYFHRLIRYYTSAALGGSINYLVLLALTRFLGWPYILSNLIGIGFGMVSNFLLSEFWVFKKRKED